MKDRSSEFWQNLLAWLSLAVFLFLMPKLGFSQPLPSGSAPKQIKINLQNQALVNFVLEDGTVVPENVIAIPSALSEVAGHVVNHSGAREANALVQKGKDLVLEDVETLETTDTTDSQASELTGTHDTGMEAIP